jgi:hypothetical protein
MNVPEIRPAPKPVRAPAPPACVQCGNPDTEPVATMRLCTSEADAWFRCTECEHVFSTSRADGFSAV